VRQDGSAFWANVVFTAIRDQSGRLRGFAKLTRDLTEPMKIEATPDESQRCRRCRQSGQKRLLATMSHELRTR